MARISCVCLALLLLVGTQLATSKSVDETFKDATHALSKRAAANDESNDDEVTTLSPENEEEEEEESSTEYVAPVSTTTTTRRPAKTRRRQTKRPTTAAPTTPAIEDDEDDEEELTTEEDNDEEPATVKPLNSEKDKPKKKQPKPQRPNLLNRIKPEEEEGPVADDKIGTAEKPASNLLPPIQPFSYFPQQPPSSYGGGFLLPPPVGQNYPAFAPWPQPSFNPAASTPYDYPHPSGPAFSEPAVGGGAFAGGFAGASASASAGTNGQGGTVSLSTSPGAGVQHSATAFNSRGSFPTPAGSTQITPNSITMRGSFPADSGDSVGIEVNGPAPAGVPAYTAGPNYGAVSGPGYSASASFGNSPGGAGFGGGVPPYQNSIPNYNAYNPVDFQSFFNQYFAALQAQQAAFQQQLQAQIEAQRQAHGSFASGGAFITNDNGQVDPTAQVYVNTQSSPNYASSSTSVDSRSGFGGSRSSVQAYPFPSNNMQGSNSNSIWDQSNRIDSNFGPYGGYSGYPAAGGGGHSSGPQSAVASASLGPQGGFQTAQISPAAPGIFSRFGDDIPAPSGGSYGVFSSSSSSSGVGPDGKQINHKTATIGVNDNGKVSYKTVHDP